MDMRQMMGANNPDAVPSDSFTGGVEDLESALMEGPVTVIDELQQMPQKEGGEMNQEMIMQLMQAMMGGGM